jgi:hypothetical protein
VSGAVVAADANGDVLRYSLDAAALPTHGRVVLQTDGTFVHTPNAGYVGRDSFSVLVDDGRGGMTRERVDLSFTTSKAGDSSGGSHHFSIETNEKDGEKKIDFTPGKIEYGGCASQDETTCDNAKITVISADEKINDGDNAKSEAFGQEGNDRFILDVGHGTIVIDGGSGAQWTDILDLATNMHADARVTIAMPDGNDWSVVTDGSHVVHATISLGQDKSGDVVIHGPQGDSTVHFSNIEAIKV